MFRLQLYKHVISLILLLMLGYSSMVRAGVIYSTDFNDQNSVRTDWRFVGAFLTEHPNAVVDGAALGFGSRAYVYHYLDIPADTESITISFWVKVGDSSIFGTPSGDSAFTLWWFRGSWQTYEIDRGRARAGQGFTYQLTIPRNQFGPLPLILLSSRGSFSSYFVDNFRITSDGGGPDRLEVSVGQSNASVCTPNPISLSVRDSSNNIMTSFEGVVDITTSSGNGNWSMVTPNGRLIVGANDSGSASYTFESSDQGQVVLQLSNQRAENLQINVAVRDGTANGQSTEISFRENAFVFDFSRDSSDVIAYRAHNVDVRLMRRDPDNGDCGIATDYNINEIRLRFRSEPGDSMAIEPNWIIDGVIHGTNYNHSRKPLRFVNGEANFQLVTYDVGRFTIGINDNSRSFTNERIDTNSQQLVSRPFALNIDVSANPGATDYLGASFRKAGENFSVQLSAVGWQASDDVNSDGVADGHNNSLVGDEADLSNNPLLAGFSIQGIPQSAKLSARSIAPTALAHAELNGSNIFFSFSGGQSNPQSLNYSNVGIMELSAAINGNSYLGSSTAISEKIQGRSGAVGRFIPNHFTLSNQSIELACESGSFTHMGEPFRVSTSIQAENLQGLIVDGYQGDYAKLSDSLGELNYKASGNSGRLQAPSESLLFNLGVAQLSSELILVKDNTPQAPLMNLSIGLSLEDDDLVRLADAELDLDLEGNDSINDHALLGISDFYYSRLSLASAHGPETQDLPSKLYVESWQGNSFQRNSLDSCTALRRSDVSYVQTGPLSSGNNRTVPIGSGESKGEYLDWGRNNIKFLSGDAGQYFTAPGSGNRGVIEVDIDLQNYPWLQFDWNKDGVHNDRTLPRASFQFGGVRGHDSVVYWRETN